MEINADQIALTLSLTTLAGLIWRSATEHANTKASINDVRDQLRYKYDLEVQRLKAEIEKIEYYSNSIREQLEHKSQRYEREIRQLKGYLQKKFDFSPRSQRLENYCDDDPPTGPL